MGEYKLSSSDNKTTLHCVEWEPNKEPVAALLIVHGMCEYILRYKDFASSMAKEGYYVCGHDHIGHGESINSEKDFGYFDPQNGNDNLLSDIDTQIERIREKYPNTPVFILGHSMGSFLVRQYICNNYKKLNGAIIMGSGTQPGFNLSFGKSLSKLLSVFAGWHHRSKMIQLIAFGSYLKRIKKPQTSRDWLTKDHRIVEDYMSKKECMYIFTLTGFYNMFKSIGLAQDKSNVSRIEKDFPLYFVSGSEDPVCGYEKGFEKLVNLYKDCGIKNIKFKLYKGDRHEILNELDRVIVYQDIMNFIDDNL